MNGNAGSRFIISWQWQWAQWVQGSMFKVLTRLSLPGGRRAESKSELVESSRFKFFIELAVAAGRLANKWVGHGGLGSLGVLHLPY
tara:strand:- start:1181 stop:1438 length:258 start_codon:yes stop_codon:yes gene_type:complete